jgi:predicted double-glycine peptidase
MMIDTEGYELNVLKGAEQTIKEYKPVLVLEFHNRNLTQKFGYSLHDLKQYVENLGYRSVGYINKVDQVFVSEA